MSRVAASSVLPARELEAWASLWAEDAVWEHPRFGISNGRDAIRKVCANAFEALPMIHFVGTLGGVTVDGDAAHGRVWISEATTSTRVGPNVVMGLYEDDYVRRGGRWFFRKRVYTYRLRAKLDPMPLM